MLEGLPLGAKAWLHKQVVQSPDKQGVEGHDDHQCHHSLNALLWFYLENIEYPHFSK